MVGLSLFAVQQVNFFFFFSIFFYYSSYYFHFYYYYYYKSPFLCIDDLVEDEITVWVSQNKKERDWRHYVCPPTPMVIIIIIIIFLLILFFFFAFCDFWEPLFHFIIFNFFLMILLIIFLRNLVSILMRLGKNEQLQRKKMGFTGIKYIHLYIKPI